MPMRSALRLPEPVKRGCQGERFSLNVRLPPTLRLGCHTVGILEGRLLGLSMGTLQDRAVMLRLGRQRARRSTRWGSVLRGDADALGCHQTSLRDTRTSSFLTWLWPGCWGAHP